MDAAEKEYSQVPFCFFFEHLLTESMNLIDWTYGIVKMVFLFSMDVSISFFFFDNSWMYLSLHISLPRSLLLGPGSSTFFNQKKEKAAANHSECENHKLLVAHTENKDTH